MDSRTFFCLTLLFSSFVAHNYLTNPVSRGDQKDTQTGCRVGGEGNPNCPGPCEKPSSQSRTPIAVKRGDSITLNWYRHNHEGGFVRFAWAPTASSDTHSEFDSRVQIIVCKEIGGCGPSDPGDITSTNGIDCGYTFKVPNWLTDGAWTLQWAYFGGYYNAGDYYACVDYTVSGGTAVGTQPAATFQGGDVTFPNQGICRFYSTDQLHVCVVEPCTTGTYPAGAQSGPAHGFTGTSTPVSATATSTSTTAPHSTSTTTTTTTTSTSTSTTAKHSTSTSTSTSTTAPHSTSTSTTSSSGGAHSSTTSQPPLTTAKAALTTSKSALTTGSKSVMTTGLTKLCYLPGTPNPHGHIKHDPPVCGANSPKSRCADGQCCSQYGYCGPIASTDGNYYEQINGVYTQLTHDQAVALYCVNNTGDYRKYPCNTLPDNAIVAPSEDYDDSSSLVTSAATSFIHHSVLTFIFATIFFYVFVMKNDE